MDRRAIGDYSSRGHRVHTPVFLPGESQGQGSLVGCGLWGCTESDMTEATQQQQQQHLLNTYCALDIILGILGTGLRQIQ